MIYFFRWHSINLIPHASICSTYDTKKCGTKIYGRLFQLTIFGIVINISWKTNRSKKAWFSPTLGYSWSRDDKRWWKFYD